VVDKFLIELESQLNEKHVQVDVSEEARHWLAEKGFDPQMGARPMSRMIQEHVKRALADELLFGKLVDGGRVRLGVADGELVVETEAGRGQTMPAVV